MSQILFEILKAVLILTITLVVRYAIPYIKLQLDKQNLSWVTEWVITAVRAAEQTIIGNKTGTEKKEYVTKFVKDMVTKQKIPLTVEQIDNLIEAAVLTLKDGGQV